MNEKLTLIETIANNPKLSTFSRLLGTSKANELLSGVGPWTVIYVNPADDPRKK